jgi:hypothetical protein
LTIEVESHRRGYPRLAAFLNSAHEFAIFRRFGLLRTRILLYKQDELVELETKLIKLDNEEQVPYHLCSRRSNPSDVQKALVAEIEKKLKEYGKTFLCSPGLILGHEE